MNPDVKQMWLKDLRSGEFEQGQGYLRAEDKYCCLGVLCEIAVREGVISPPEKAAYGDYYRYGDDLSRDYLVLPQAVREWAGLEKAGPEVPVPPGFPEDPCRDGSDVISLTELNDHAEMPYSFPQLADLIEEHL
jgi:hypothetical protein